MKINEYFLALQKQMIARLSSERDIIFHPGTKGDATELNWLDWLRTYIPKRYCVDKAFIIDSEGSISDQIDLVVYDQHYSPFVFNQDSAIYVPAESIYAVFEIKQDLTKECIEYTGKKIESVRISKRTSKPIVHAGGVYKARDLTPIIGGILTLSSVWSPPLGTAFEEAIGNLDSIKRIDIGCCLEYGAFKVDYSNDLTKIKSNSQASLISFFLDF